MNEYIYIFSRTKFLINILKAFGKNSPELIEVRKPNHWSCLLNGKVCHGSGILYYEDFAVLPDWCVVRKDNKN